MIEKRKLCRIHQRILERRSKGMKKDLKKDLLSIYVVVFLIISFFSSCAGMCLILEDIPFLCDIPIYEELLPTGVFFLHIGSYLLILSGRLKDKD